MVRLGEPTPRLTTPNAVRPGALPTPYGPQPSFSNDDWRRLGGYEPPRFRHTGAPRLLFDPARAAAFRPGARAVVGFARVDRLDCPIRRVTFLDTALGCAGVVAVDASNDVGQGWDRIEVFRRFDRSLTTAAGPRQLGHDWGYVALVQPTVVGSALGVTTTTSP